MVRALLWAAAPSKPADHCARWVTIAPFLERPVELVMKKNVCLENKANKILELELVIKSFLYICSHTLKNGLGCLPVKAEH